MIGLHKEVFDNLIKDLPFDNPRLVKGILFLACMNSIKNSEYSKRVMNQLIDRFYAIRAQAKFDDKIQMVIQELCHSMHAERVLIEFAGELSRCQDLMFA